MTLPINYHYANWRERRDARNEYIRLQAGLCYHCKCPLQGPASAAVRGKRIRHSLFPAGFFDWPVHLHHDHKTGTTIGAVHNICNAVLWQYHGQ